MEITKDTLILNILERYPQSRDVFAALGMGCLDCLGASLETVEAGARMHGLDVEKVLAALRQAVEIKDEESRNNGKARE
ncbi:MAG: DUF1858 domain-containing protein [Bacillota bacterium]